MTKIPSHKNKEILFNRQNVFCVRKTTFVSFKYDQLHLIPHFQARQCVLIVEFVTADKKNQTLLGVYVNMCKCTGVGWVQASTPTAPTSLEKHGASLKAG